MLKGLLEATIKDFTESVLIQHTNVSVSKTQFLKCIYSPLKKLQQRSSRHSTGRRRHHSPSRTAYLYKSNIPEWKEQSLSS